MAGRVIAVPTDTVYGLACLPDKPTAVARLFALKGRDPSAAIALLCSDLRQAAQFGRLPSWAGRAWPGAVTLVVRRTAASASWELGGDSNRVGLRVPAHPLVQGLSAELGPLAATSANLSGQPTPESAEGVLELFGDEVEMVVDGGRVAGAASTVIDCVSAPPKVLRQGAVLLSSLLR